MAKIQDDEHEVKLYLLLIVKHLHLLIVLKTMSMFE